MARTTVVMNLRRMAWVTARTAGVLVRMRIGYHEQTQLEGRSGMVMKDVITGKSVIQVMSSEFYSMLTRRC